MKKFLVIMLVLALVFSMAACGGTESEGEGATTTFPDRTITLIVPWNAGGSSDLIGRVLAADMAETLGVTISVVNTPGATGTVGMNDCFIADHDGYTLIANATPYSHGVMGLAQWSPSDWDFMAAYYVPGIIAVSKDSEYKTFDDLHKAIADNPGVITGGTAGVGSTGFINMEILKSVAPELGNYKNISYAGGAAAVTATLAGEVVFTPQLSNEMIDLLRSGDLVALCALTEEDLVLDGISYTIPSIKNFIPETESILPCGDAFGLMIPSDTPDDVTAILEAAYLAACETEEAINFGNEKGIMMRALNIEESNALRDATASMVGWILHDSGVAVVSPEEFGIERP